MVLLDLNYTEMGNYQSYSATVKRPISIWRSSYRHQDLDLNQKEEKTVHVCGSHCLTLLPSLQTSNIGNYQIYFHLVQMTRLWW